MKLLIAVLSMCVAPPCAGMAPPQTAPAGNLFKKTASEIAAFYPTINPNTLPKDKSFGMGPFLERIAAQPAEWILALLAADPTYAQKRGITGKTLLDYLQQKSAITPELIKAISKPIDPTKKSPIAFDAIAFAQIKSPEEFETYIAQIDPTTIPSTEIDQDLLKYLVQKDFATYSAILNNPATTRWATLSDYIAQETILHQLARYSATASLSEKIALAVQKGADKKARNFFGDTAYQIYAGTNKKDFSILAQLDPSASEEPTKAPPSGELKAFDANQITDADIPAAIAAYLDTITPGSINLIDIPTFKRLSSLKPDAFRALIMHEKGKSLVTARGQQNTTLLHEIASQLNQAINNNNALEQDELIQKIRLLIEQGADLEAQNQFGRMPYDYVTNHPQGALLIPLRLEFEKLASALMGLKN